MPIDVRLASANPRLTKAWLVTRECTRNVVLPTAASSLATADSTPSLVLAALKRLKNSGLLKFPTAARDQADAAGYSAHKELPRCIHEYAQCSHALIGRWIDVAQAGDYAPSSERTCAGMELAIWRVVWVLWTSICARVRAETSTAMSASRMTDSEAVTFSSVTFWLLMLV